MIAFPSRFVLLAIVALAACNRPTPQQPPLAAAEPAAENVSNTVIAAPPPSACAQPPRLAMSGSSFGKSSDLAKFQANFEESYAEACKAGWFSKKPLIDHRAAHSGTLFVANAPEANIASIYLDTAKQDMLLEGPFVDEAGAAHVPSPDELREAIYCHAVGATPNEQEESGRCLPD
jgi:hypothetical protein